jgi:hypothetical protein
MSFLSFHSHVSNSLFVGWYNPKTRSITNIEPWDDKPETITLTAILLKERFEFGDGKYVFPSYIWVAFDMVNTLRIFFLNQNSKPKQRDLERIKALVDDIQNGGGLEREF